MTRRALLPLLLLLALAARAPVDDDWDSPADLRLHFAKDTYYGTSSFGSARTELQLAHAIACAAARLSLPEHAAAAALAQQLGAPPGDVDGWLQRLDASARRRVFEQIEAGVRERMHLQRGRAGGAR